MPTDNFGTDSNSFGQFQTVMYTFWTNLHRFGQVLTDLDTFGQFSDIF